MRQRKIIGFKDDGSRIREWKTDKGKPVQKPKHRVLGLKPGKLSEIGAVVEINTNYGIALDPEAMVIAFHKVKEQLETIRQKNSGTPSRVLRNGALIRVKTGRYQGVWRVRSCIDNANNGILLRISWPDRVQDKQSGVDWCKDNVVLKTLLANGLEILQNQYTGASLL